MKIKDIHIDGFGVWTDLAVDSLPDGMTLFYGPNEAGKTTLMQFVRACFYGFTPERRQRYLPPVYGGVPGGAMRVTGPGGGYQIRRRGQATDGDSAEHSVSGQLTVTGQDGLAQGQHRLAMLLGQIDEPIFTNVFAIGLRELQELGTLDDTSAADELYKLSSGLDRVSLVDVLRNLRNARGKMVGAKAEAPEMAKLATLVERREKLRDEIDQLTARGRRWSELATQRRTQEQEIESLRGRLVDWEHEARVVEIATTVRETWEERDRLQKEILRIDTGTQIPDEAPGQLMQLEAQLEERREKIEAIKKQRRDLREKASGLPLSRRLVELQGRIEAANEQATWVEALEDQIKKLDDRIEKAVQEVDTDAQALGMDDEDRMNLADGRKTTLPDLSRQTLSALSTPARNVKEQLYQLKRARDESLKDKKEADALAQRLHESLDHAQARNLHESIKRQGELITTLRQCIQLEAHLEKTRKHYRDLEQESLDLATSEALPIERTLLLSVPFAMGAMALIYGIFSVFQWSFFIETTHPTTGIMFVFGGMMALGVWYLGRERGDQGNALDLEDCERQIDTLRRQIREIEAERDELDARLPSGSGPLEVRVREAEEMLRHLEGLLPTYHGHQASLERYQAARKRASIAADGLKQAKSQWRKTLISLGLSESMSPGSIRKLSENYETLQSSRRKVDELVSEREQRRRELQILAKRVEQLYLEALGPEAPSEEEAKNKDKKARDRDDEFDEIETRPNVTAKAAVGPKLRVGPLEQLNHLNEELARQQHWIKRRRELKEQDVQLQKQQAMSARSIQRIDGMRRSLWAKCGVATAEQFYQMVDTKTRIAELKKEAETHDRQVRSIIGNQCSYEDVFRELEGAKGDDLKRRWESLTQRIEQTEERIAGLQTRQGELAQEMRTLAEDRRLSHAQLELECIERQLESLAERWQTLAMASCLLEDVCRTFEKERQPETLREASSFLAQLTDGKYTRIWTPLGTNQLKIDGAEGKSLPIEVLSRGTREAVFIALRLALAAAYARRGVMLPLVLDDVLVNFDRKRAIDAAKTLKTFAELGHQVMMFTCHDHIAQIFHDIDVQVRLLPAQGRPGVATIMPPPVREEIEYEPEELLEEEPYLEEVPPYEEPEELEAEEELEPVLEIEEEPEPEPILVQIQPPPPRIEPQPLPPPPEPIVIVQPPAPRPAPVVVQRPKPVAPPPPPKIAPTPEPEPDLDWVWYQRELDSEWFDDSPDTEAAPPEVWKRPGTWWTDDLATTKSPE